MNTTELLRLILNLVRKGSVLEVNYTTARCRVQSGDLQTNWITWLSLAAGETRDWNPPTPGEQVLLLCPSGDPADAVALRGLYSSAAPAPRTGASLHTRVFPDGAVVEYDHKSHVMTITLPQGGIIRLVAPQAVTVHTTTATIVASELVKIESPLTEMTGNLRVAGTINAGDAITTPATVDAGEVKAAGTISAGADITTPADVKAGQISLVKHLHQEKGDGKPVGEAY